MSEPFIGQIIRVAFPFAPKGYALCSGQILPISANQALFSLLGTTYGGNGTTTFGLPNLQGRIPLGSGQGPGLSNYALGQTAGEDAHTLTVNEMPSHNHVMNCDSQTGTMPTPGGHLFAEEQLGAAILYSDQAPDGIMNPGAIGSTGGSQPHNNVMPTLAVNFCIATQGIYPPRD